MAKKKNGKKRFSYAPRSSKANTQVSAIVEPMISKMMKENPTTAGDITPFVWALVFWSKNWWSCRNGSILNMGRKDNFGKIKRR